MLISLMPKSRSRSMRMSKNEGSMHYKCDCYHHKIGWILPLLIIAIALMPNWYNTPWGKWAIVVLAAVMFGGKFCRCC